MNEERYLIEVDEAEYEFITTSAILLNIGVNDVVRGMCRVYALVNLISNKIIKKRGN